MAGNSYEIAMANAVSATAESAKAAAVSASTASTHSASAQTAADEAKSARTAAETYAANAAQSVEDVKAAVYAKVDEELSATSTSPLQNKWLGIRLGATDKNSIQIGYGAKAGSNNNTTVADGDYGLQVAIGSRSNGSSSGVAVGVASSGYSSGTAVGGYSNGYSSGTAVGMFTNGYSSGTAVGYSASGYSSGTAVGKYAAGYSSGTAVGYSASGYSSGTAVGYGAEGQDNGVAVGYCSMGPYYSVAIGIRAGVSSGGHCNISERTISVGANAYANAEGAIAIGSLSETSEAGGIVIGRNATASGGTSAVAIGEGVNSTDGALTIASGEMNGHRAFIRMRVIKDADLIGSSLSVENVGKPCVEFGFEDMITGEVKSTLIAIGTGFLNGQMTTSSPFNGSGYYCSTY